MGGSW
ncbi:unnamed protein product, partial [Rhodiola kirilowii]